LLTMLQYDSSWERQKNMTMQKQ